MSSKKLNTESNSSANKQSDALSKILKSKLSKNITNSKSQ